MTLASRYKVRLLRQAIREVLGGFGNKSAGKGGTGENVHGGVPRTAHSNGNILDDEAADLDALKQDEQERSAACCFILKNGKVLAVSRRNDPTMWGMPGGKVDIGEDAEHAAARELMEETGLTATSMSQIYTAVDAQGYRTTTFSCGVQGKIDTDESGVVRWVDPSVLIDPSTSPFVKYNRELLQTLGMLK